MRYFFVFLSIIAVWVAILAIAALVSSIDGFTLYFCAVVVTLTLFFIGFYRK